MTRHPGDGRSGGGLSTSAGRTASKNAERLAKLASGERPRGERIKDPRWMAGVAGLATIPAAVAGALSPVRCERDSVDDPHAAEDFTLLDFYRASVVTTADGVPLAVREVGPADAPLTVVFAHGFCMCMGAYHFQRARLEEEWGEVVRMVFYDQRGHGQSGRAPIRLHRGAARSRSGRRVGGGGSARTRRAGGPLDGRHDHPYRHARQFPQHYGSRVVGAALISTAAEGVARSPLGKILRIRHWRR